MKFIAIAILVTRCSQVLVGQNNLRNFKDYNHSLKWTILR